VSTKSSRRTTRKASAPNRRKLRLQITVVIEPDGDSFHAYCPAFKGLHVDGANEKEALRNAAEQKVRIHSNKIASSLLKGTLAGNANSAKMLVSLVDGKAAKPRKRMGPTVAEQMAADEPWVDEIAGKLAEKTINAEES